MKNKTNMRNKVRNNYKSGQRILTDEQTCDDCDGQCECDEQDEEDEDEGSETELEQLAQIAEQLEVDMPFTISVGELDEKKTHELVESILTYAKICKAAKEKHKETVGEDGVVRGKLEILDVIMYVDSYGGNVHNMFSICDAMEYLKKYVDIETIGTGAVMSAAVLILASGTLGKRKIGKRCRVMLHPVQSLVGGSIANNHNEQKETKVLQNLFVRSLVESTNMTERDVKAIINKDKNVYFSAEDAVSKGIADVIL